MVESDPAISELCLRLLSAEGFVVDGAMDGQTARSMISKHKYSLCICDFRAPLMSGWEFYNYVQQHCPQMGRGIIFTSAAIAEDDEQRFVEATGNTYLPKPFTPAELRAKVRGIIERSAT